MAEWIIRKKYRNSIRYQTKSSERWDKQLFPHSLTIFAYVWPNKDQALEIKCPKSE